jgi:hypothetical protein
MPGRYTCDRLLLNEANERPRVHSIFGHVLAIGRVKYEATEATEWLLYIVLVLV